MKSAMQFIYERPTVPKNRLIKAEVAAPITLAILLPLAYLATGDISRPIYAQFPLTSISSCLRHSSSYLSFYREAELKEQAGFTSLNKPYSFLHLSAS